MYIELSLIYIVIYYEAKGGPVYDYKRKKHGSG